MQTPIKKPVVKSIIAVSLGIIASACSSGIEDSKFEFERIDPPTLNYHPFYSQVTTVRGPSKFIYVAGQVDRPIDYTSRSNRCQHDDWYGQYIGMHENVEQGLKAAGATWNNVVFIRRYIVDIDGWRKMIDDKEHPLPNYWEGHRPPPSTLIQVVALSEPCQLMETDVFAVIADPGA